MAQTFNLTPVSTGTLNNNTPFTYQPIINTTDINGNAVQIYGQAQNMTLAQVATAITNINAQIAKLQANLANLTSMQTQMTTAITPVLSTTAPAVGG